MPNVKFTTTPGKLYKVNSPYRILALPVAEFKTASRWKYIYSDQIFMLVNNRGFNANGMVHATALVNDRIWVLDAYWERNAVQCLK